MSNKRLLICFKLFCVIPQRMHKSGIHKKKKEKDGTECPSPSFPLHFTIRADGSQHEPFSHSIGHNPNILACMFFPRSFRTSESSLGWTLFLSVCTVLCVFAMRALLVLFFIFLPNKKRQKMINQNNHFSRSKWIVVALVNDRFVVVYPAS